MKIYLSDKKDWKLIIEFVIIQKIVIDWIISLVHAGIHIDKRRIIAIFSIKIQKPFFDDLGWAVYTHPA